MSALLAVVCGLLVPLLQGIPLPGIIDGCKDCPPAVPELYKKFVGEKRPPGLSAGYLVFHTLIYAPIGHLEGREVYDGPDNKTKYVRGFDDEITSEEAAKRCSEQKGGLPDVANVDPAFLSWVVAGAFKVPAKVWVQNGTVDGSGKCLALNALNSIVEDVECGVTLRVLCEVQNDDQPTDNTTSTGSSVATTTPSTTSSASASTTDTPSVSTPTTTTTSTITTTTTTTTTRKKKHDATYGDYYYKLIYVSGPKNGGIEQDEMDGECQKFGARLASIHSAEEENVVAGIYDKQLCTNATWHFTDGAFLGSVSRGFIMDHEHLDEKTMRNLDGTPYDYGHGDVKLSEDITHEVSAYAAPWCNGTITTITRKDRPYPTVMRAAKVPNDPKPACWEFHLWTSKKCGICKKSQAGN